MKRRFMQLVSLFCAAIMLMVSPAPAFAGQVPAAETDMVSVCESEEASEPLAASETEESLLVDAKRLTKELYIYPPKFSVYLGETFQMQASVSPYNASDKTLIWSSSDESVVTVSDGLLTPVSAGTAIITATTRDSGKTDSSEVSVLIAPRSVSLDKSDITIGVGEKVTLKTSVLPANADDTNFKWYTSNSFVAEVNQKGEVTGKRGGTTTITVRFNNDPEIEASCTVFVENPTVSIRFPNASLVMTKIGNTKSQSVIYDPTDATDRALTWTSSDESVATVDDRGNVTAVGYGRTTITAETENGRTASYEMIVSVPASGIWLSEKTLSMAVGDTKTLTALVQPGDTADKKVVWSSSNINVARVNSDGEVTAVGVGQAYVKVSTPKGRFPQQCLVTVSSDVTGVSLDRTSLSMHIGESQTLQVRLLPEGVEDKGLKWLTSNSRIASVSEDGKVKALRAGSVTITAKASNGKTADCKVTVLKDDVWERLYGTGRYDTMQAIVKAGFKNKGGTLVVAAGTSFKDALAASGLAGIYRGPVLLTDGAALSGQAGAELKRLKPARVYVAGGTFAVSDKVFEEIRTLTGADVERVSGANSSATSAELALAGQGSWSDTAIIATNKSFKDALSAAPLSYALHMPIFLSDNGKSLSREVLDAMYTCEIRKVIIVGGSLAVSANVEKQLKSNGITNIRRIGEQTAVQTSAAIARAGIDMGMEVNYMGVATSQNFPDALAGAAFCGYNRSVLVLADDKAMYNTSFPTAYKHLIKKGYVFGGPGAVGDKTMKALEAAVK